MRALHPTHQAATHTFIFPIIGMEECQIRTQDGRLEANAGELRSCAMVEFLGVMSAGDLVFSYERKQNVDNMPASNAYENLLDNRHFSLN